MEDIEGHGIFLFTNNTVYESISAKGLSTSEVLYNLIVRVLKLEMRYCYFVRFVHVAGIRMIQWGADGLYRGDVFENFLKGEFMLTFVALHKGDIEV